MNSYLNKRIALFLALTMSVGSLAHAVAAAPAAEFTQQINVTAAETLSLSEVSSGTCGENLTWSLTEDGTLTISGTGNITEHPWSDQAASITAVVLESGITGIGESAFKGCSSLKAVTIPDTVTTVGKFAFQGCTGLTSIAFPDSVNTFGTYTLAGCTALKEIRLPNTITTIPEGMFSGCSGLEEFTIPDGVKTVGRGVFYSCGALTTLVVPASVTRFEDSLGNCYELTALRFQGARPAGLTGEISSTNQNMVIYCKDAYLESFMELMTWTENHAKHYKAYLLRICTGENPAALDDRYVTLVNDEAKTLTASVNEHTEGLQVTWRSGDTNVVTVDADGTLHQGRHGTTLVYATVDDGSGKTVVASQVYSRRDEDLISQLPTEGVMADFPVTCSTTGYHNATGVMSSYMPAKYVEKDTDNETFQALYAIMEDLTRDCTTDYEKAQAIQKWVSSEIRYGGTLAMGENISQIYAVYEGKQSRCMGYSKLTGLLLYMAGIPNAIVVSDMIGHMWNLALVEGRWIMVDATFNDFDFGFDDPSHGYIDHICFGQDNLCFVVDDMSGVKLAGVGWHQMQRGEETAAVIPDYVTTIFGGAFAYAENLTEVTIPMGVTAIGSDAFRRCNALTDLYYQGTLAQWSEIEISSTIPSNVVIHCNDGVLDPNAPDTDPIPTPDPTPTPDPDPEPTPNPDPDPDPDPNPTPDPDSEPPAFTDVPEDQWYYNAVNWAVENGITAGYEDNTFRPDNTCTRAQIVQFLYNQAGKPAYSATENPFTDVKEGGWYYDAVLWAVEQGITSGMGDGTFGINNPCTREQAVTFLWNAQGKLSATSTEGGFGDVPVGQWYYDSVMWAVENKVTAGIGGGLFGVGNPCTRAAIVQFLYNLENK